jgi:methylglutaconyl-CoA hydratase
MNYEYIQCEVKERVRYITLNRVDKRNAFNHQFVAELKDAFILAEEDEDTKVIVLRANGEVFSAGADLQYLQSLQKNTYEENLADSQFLKELYHHMYMHNKIIIAQVEGHAIAGGCGLATVADFTFAVPEAQFGYTEVKIGFVPAIVMVFLLRKIGETKAKELLLTGKLITAQTAKDMGIIHEVVSKDTIQDEVFSFAQKLCKETSGDSLKITKSMISAVQNMKDFDALNYAAEMNATARATKDCKKGIASFLAKEKIVW